MSTREAHLQDWLQEVEDLELGNQEEIGRRWLSNRTLIDLICEYFYELGEEPNELLDPVCVQLLRLYQTRCEPVVAFVRQTIPVLIDAYLRLVVAGRRQEIFTDANVPKVQLIRIPNLSVPSIYHDPLNLSQLGLMEPSALANGRRRTELAAVAVGPFPSVESLSAQVRPLVVSSLLKLYNVTASAATRESLLHGCRVVSRLCRSGLSSPEPDLVRQVFGSGSVEAKEWSRYHRPTDLWNKARRVPLHSAILLEALSLCYFAMFNDLALPGMQAMEDIQLRAGYELWSEVLLAVGSVVDSLLANPSGQPSEGPMGIKVDVGQHRRDTVKTGLITNASFKGSKLPDDIPVPRLPSDLASDHTLTTLSEESIEAPLAAPRKSSSTKAVLAALGLPTPGRMKTSHSSDTFHSRGGPLALHKAGSVGEAVPEAEPPLQNGGHRRGSRTSSNQEQMEKSRGKSSTGSAGSGMMQNGLKDDGSGPGFEPTPSGHYFNVGLDHDHGGSDDVKVVTSPCGKAPKRRGSKKRDRKHADAAESRDGPIELSEIGPRV